MPKPYVPNDTWSQRAAKEGYRARSIYKLQELDERFGLLHPGMCVLDVGAAPGSWLQYTAKRIGTHGAVIGIDLSPIKHVAPNVQTFVCDLTDHDAVRHVLAEAKCTQVDIVLSDIAPNTSGIKDVDQWRSVELSQHVVALAQRVLKPGGTIVLKVFRGKSFDAFVAEVKAVFRRINVVSVEASRDRSKEVYVVGFAMKGNNKKSVEEIA